MGKKSKNLKEAEKKFKEACKNKDPKEIAIASVEMLMCDKDKMKALAESFIQGRKLFSFIRKTVKSKELTKLNRRQLRSLVIRKWKEIKKRDNVELSKEAERITINAIVSALFNKDRITKVAQCKCSSEKCDLEKTKKS